DSITTGFGAGGSRLGYFERLVQNAPEDPEDIKGRNLSLVFPDLTVRNYSTNASSSGDHLRSQMLYLEKQKPEVFGIITITTGGIDLIHNYGKEAPRDEACYGASWQDGINYAKKFRERLEKILDGIQEKFPGGCKIFLANIYDPTDSVGDIENVHPLLRLVQKLPPWPDGIKILELFNRHIKEAAQARNFVYLVDIHSVMLGHGIHCKDTKNPHYRAEDPTYWYYFNLEDPNQRGYDAIRRAFLLEMIKAFKEK
ncbi:MAG: SGNH/GDSL hydrolase family protein, partial [Candidatus Brocadiae bacterium]|nr:SGNH/GDSL hydrolase family protein [Candidatus Brocadiia bacterium]